MEGMAAILAYLWEEVKDARSREGSRNRFPATMLEILAEEPIRSLGHRVQCLQVARGRVMIAAGLKFLELRVAQAYVVTPAGHTRSPGRSAVSPDLAASSGARSARTAAIPGKAP
jgi:hypothetical protein